jgi:hypothetical protein
LQWDASIYNCIKENGYKLEDSCYGKVRAAFFPLFPFLWKMTGASPITISILNYLIFVLALSLLIIYLLPNDIYLRATTFILLITFPTSVIYIIPYTESLFMFCMTIAVIGLLKVKYPLYFIGALLLAMVRPATIFVLLAIISSEIFFFLIKGDFKCSIKNIISKSLPFLIGYLMVIIIQHLSSGSWTAFVDAQKFWTIGIQRIVNISDWSIEGFGMNTFSIFFIAIPAMVFLIYLGLRIKSKKQSMVKLIDETNKSYLLLISLFYLTGILLFSILTAGGNFHSLFRFIVCSPLFFKVVLIIISKISGSNTKLLALVFTTLVLLLFTYLSLVDYGGDRLQFSFVGLFMLVITSGYILFRRFLSIKLDLTVLSLIVIINTIWNTYMLNMYLSNGWIFT